MANEEHLGILELGVKRWNLFRDSTVVVPDFSNHSFRGAFLSGVNFRGANLRNCDFSLANLRNADLTDSDTFGAVFTGASLNGAKIGALDGPMSSPLTILPDEIDPELVKDLAERKEDERLRNKIARLQNFDIPQRRYQLISVSVSDHSIHARGVGVENGSAFSDVFETVEKLARDIASSGYLANSAPSMDKAIRRYIEAIDQYYDGGGEILLGLSGQIFMLEFEANKKLLENIGEERVGTLSAFLFSHGLLEKLMPGWTAMLADTELPKLFAQGKEVEGIALDVVQDLRRTPRVDESLPVSIQRIIDARRRGNVNLKAATFAVLRAIEDVFIELFTVIVKTYKVAKQKFIQVGGVVLAASVISIMVSAGAGRLAELSPGLFSWITRGLRWLKEMGFL